MGGGAAALGVVNQNRLGKGDMDFQEIADTIDTDTETYKDTESLERARNLQGLAQSYADIQSRGGTLTGLQKGGFMRVTMTWYVEWKKQTRLSRKRISRRI